MSPIVVAYCSDAGMAMPVRVSAFALLSHLKVDREVVIHVIQQNWSLRDKDRLQKVLEATGRSFALRFHDADLSPFESFPSLHGDRTTYARLLLPSIIDADRILYIDADTLPLLDISQVFDVDLGGQIIGAVAWNVTADTSLDRKTLLFERIPGDTPYFNAGVLVIDARRFREEQVFDRCITVAHRLGDRLISHDQTLLNLVLHGQIQPLRWGFNVRLGYDTEPYQGSGLAHFIGALKPWDPFAHFLHGNACLWRAWAREGGERMPFSWRSVSRVLDLAPTYTILMRKRLAGSW